MYVDFNVFKMVSIKENKISTFIKNRITKVVIEKINNGEIFCVKLSLDTTFRNQF